MCCCVCEHPKRREIEAAIIDSPNTETLKALSEEYGISVLELQAHACMHSPLGVDTKNIESKTSLARESKVHEAEMLLAAASNYAQTIEIIGQRIKEEAINGDFIDFSRSLSRSAVDLYLGSGGELRNTVKEISSINVLLNGPSTDTASGLAALAEAIKASKAS